MSTKATDGAHTPYAVASGSRCAASVTRLRLRAKAKPDKSFTSLAPAFSYRLVSRKGGEAVLLDYLAHHLPYLFFLRRTAIKPSSTGASSAEAGAAPATQPLLSLGVVVALGLGRTLE